MITTTYATTRKAASIITACAITTILVSASFLHAAAPPETYNTDVKLKLLADGNYVVNVSVSRIDKNGKSEKLGVPTVTCAAGKTAEVIIGVTNFNKEIVDGVRVTIQIPKKKSTDPTRVKTEVYKARQVVYRDQFEMKTPKKIDG